MRISVTVALLLAACGGGSNLGTAAPVASSAQALREFMKAAADSSISRMAELWGTSHGPAGATRNPADFEKRLILIQTYLRADSTKVVSDIGVPGEEDQRRLQVAIYRMGCMKQVPALMLRLKNGGWIVNNIELASAGNPARPCEES
ncbi:MAG: hypothetical protein HOP28_10775 [Gemmatimonadales bacterium]|nr:hypothetical protein [Gemmatimonadales bacterium]